MNIVEDYRYFVRKKIQTKDYQKEYLKDKRSQTLPNYSAMPKEDLDNIIKEKLMKKFKSWIQLMFEGELVSITKC